MATQEIRASGESASADSTISETIGTVVLTGTAGTAGITARDVNTAIADFSSVDLIDASSLVTSIVVDYAVIAAGAGNIDGIVLFLNSSIGKVQMFYDADLDSDNALADTAATVITFDNITSLVGVADTFAQSKPNACMPGSRRQATRCSNTLSRC